MAARIFNFVSKYNEYVENNCMLTLAIVSYSKTLYFYKIYFRYGLVLGKKKFLNEISKIRKFSKAFF